VTAAVSLAAIPHNEWFFIGFVPQKKGRLTALKEMCARKEATVMYESSHRIIKLLTELALHGKSRSVGIAREITKKFEEFVQGTPEELLMLFKTNPQKEKGEFVVIVYPLGYNRVYE
jgi:16S rRNA (cytidine1402-2'-O)-methyltransferase